MVTRELFDGAQEVVCAGGVHPGAKLKLHYKYRILEVARF